MNEPSKDLKVPAVDETKLKWRFVSYGLHGSPFLRPGEHKIFAECGREAVATVYSIEKGYQWVSHIVDLHNKSLEETNQ